MDYEDGSVFAGIILGLFLSILGFIIALATGKSKTIKGAGVGIGLDILLGIIIGIVVIYAYYSQGGSATW